MSNIVAFKPDRRSRSTSAAEEHGGAQILFFTGVRYMRVLDLDDVVAETGRDGVEDECAAAGREQAERLQA
jgi:hypothetical protein